MDLPTIGGPTRGAPGGFPVSLGRGHLDQQHGKWSETALEDDDFFLIQLNYPRLAVILGGGFKYFFEFSPLFREDVQFDEHIFQMGGKNHQLEYIIVIIW